VLPKWNRPDGPDILIISAVGMTGINLAAARVIILVVSSPKSAEILQNLTVNAHIQDQVFSDQEKKQLVGRIWRYPQQHVCIMYELILNNTCDEVLYNISQGKALMMESFIEGDSVGRTVIESILEQSELGPMETSVDNRIPHAIGVPHSRQPGEFHAREPLTWAEYLHGLPEFLQARRSASICAISDTEITWTAYLQGLPEWLARRKAIDGKSDSFVDISVRAPSPPMDNMDVDHDCDLPLPELPEACPPVLHQSYPSPLPSPSPSQSSSGFSGYKDSVTQPSMPQDLDYGKQPTAGPSETYDWGSLDAAIDIIAVSAEPAISTSSGGHTTAEESVRPKKLWYRAVPVKATYERPTMIRSTPFLVTALHANRTPKEPPLRPLGGAAAARQAVYANLSYKKLAEARNASTTLQVRPARSDPIDFVIHPIRPA
jgi:hypothetical protein